MEVQDMFRLKLFFISIVFVLSFIIALPAAAASWTTTGDLNTGRYRHTATLLPDGKVLNFC